MLERLHHVVWLPLTTWAKGDWCICVRASWIHKWEQNTPCETKLIMKQTQRRFPPSSCITHLLTPTCHHNTHTHTHAATATPCACSMGTSVAIIMVCGEAQGRECTLRVLQLFVPSSAHMWPVNALRGFNDSCRRSDRCCIHYHQLMAIWSLLIRAALNPQ